MSRRRRWARRLRRLARWLEGPPTVNMMRESGLYLDPDPTRWSQIR